MKIINIIIVVVIVLIFSIALSSCVVQEPKKPSFLIVFIDSVDFNFVACHNAADLPVEKSGMSEFCQSSVRFHHAYTPSVLVQPALASLLTGLYPYEHGVWSNGSHFLSSQFRTVPEEAIKKGYRSSFFSGGGAIWRKSGLNQGFEVFDDNVKLSWQQIHRPAIENVKLFLKWLDRSKKPFLSVLYLPDLQLPEFSLGQKKLSLESARDWHVLDQALYHLIYALKKRKKWHSTYVILLGTKPQKADSSFRSEEIPAWSLFSDNTQVSLFIKGLSRFRKTPRYGNINTPITIADIGWTLFDLLGSSVLQQKEQVLKEKLFPVISLKKYLLKEPKVNIHSKKLSPNLNILNAKTPENTLSIKGDDVFSDRILLIESGWPLWRKMGLSRFAIRKGPYLFIYDKKPHLYNSLTDRQELHSISYLNSHPNLLQLRNKFLFYFDKMGIKPWKKPSFFVIEKLRLGQRLFSLSPFHSSIEVQDKIRVLMEQDPSDKELIAWRARLALQNKQWQVLKSLGKKTNNFFWEYLANSYLMKETRKKAKEECEILFAKRIKTKCEDQSLLSLYEWIYNKDQTKNKKLRSRFFYFYLREKTDQKITHLNHQTYLMWDTNILQFQKPLLADLFLHLPEHKKYLKIVNDVLFRSG